MWGPQSGDPGALDVIRAFQRFVLPPLAHHVEGSLSGDDPLSRPHCWTLINSPAHVPGHSGLQEHMVSGGRGLAAAAIRVPRADRMEQALN